MMKSLRIDVCSFPFSYYFLLISHLVKSKAKKSSLWCKNVSSLSPFVSFLYAYDTLIGRLHKNCLSWRMLLSPGKFPQTPNTLVRSLEDVQILHKLTAGVNWKMNSMNPLNINMVTCMCLFVRAFGTAFMHTLRIICGLMNATRNNLTTCGRGSRSV